MQSQAMVQERYQAALDALVAKLKQDRYILAAILFGSVARGEEEGAVLQAPPLECLFADRWRATLWPPEPCSGSSFTRISRHGMADPMLFCSSQDLTEGRSVT